MRDPVTFDDLLDIRKGGEDLTMGGGETRVEPLTSLAEWETKAAALRELFRMTLGRLPDDIACPTDPTGAPATTNAGAKQTQLPPRSGTR